MLLLVGGKYKDIIESTYNKNFLKVYRFFYYKILSKEKAEDLTSSVFVDLIDKLGKQHEIENIEKYLFGIAKIKFLEHLKNKYKTAHLDYEEFNEQRFGIYMEDFVEEIDQKPTIEDKALGFIDRLPEKQKIVIRKRLIEKKSLGEICKDLKKDMNYVKTTQKRGLKKLREMVACTL